MHRRFYLLLIILIAGTTALVSAQDAPPEDAPLAEPITIERGPDAPDVFGPLQGEWSPLELEPVEPPSTTPNMLLDHAADLCSQATPLELEDGTSGDLTTVNWATVSPDDPVLSCMYGNPLSNRGYRTVWYRFQPAVAGTLTAYTDFNPSDFSDSYDTVIALYQSGDGTCNNLQPVACNDDHSGYFSRIETFVEQNQVYYLEVADWHFSVNAAATLRLAIVLEKADSFWGREIEDLLPRPRSRHMVVTDGRYFYILGGETVIEPFPERNQAVLRYDPLTGHYEALYPMPAPAYPGYSRTSAVYLNGKIYTPSGFVGNTSLYDGTHWVYDTATNSWTISTPVPWNSLRQVDNQLVSPTGEPYAWAEAVASPVDRGYFLTGGLASGDPNPVFPSDAQPVGRLLFFRPAADGTGGTWNVNFPDMSVPRYAHTAAMLNTPEGRKICVTGGIGKVTEDQAAVLRTTECYNTVRGVWEEAAPLNQSRFSAGSAVGPDGRWYVFGGITVVGGTLGAVLATEVYDPASNTWELLDSRYNLEEPGRAWPRGAFVDNTLWVFGGETWPDRDALSLVEALNTPYRVMLGGVQTTNQLVKVEPNDTFIQAQIMAVGVRGGGNFEHQEDYFDFYQFYIDTPGVYAATVSSIPDGHNYDVYLFNANKYPVGEGTAPGDLDDTAVTLPLDPGWYYAMVVRVFGTPTADAYYLDVYPIP